MFEVIPMSRRVRSWGFVAVLSLIAASCTGGSTTDVTRAPEPTTTGSGSVAPPTTQAARPRPTPAVRASPFVPSDSSVDWAVFSAGHNGLAQDTSIGASNVADLQLLWQTHTGQSSYASPAVAWNDSLQVHLVYAGNQTGVIAAFDATTGDRVWVFEAGEAVQSSPTIVDGVLYVGSGDDNLYALDATTGSLICSFDTGGNVSSSPVVHDFDGSGKIVYFGDNGLTGGDDGGALWAVNAVDPNPAEDCSEVWRFDAFGQPSGSEPDAGVWSPPSVATDKTGRPLIVFGSSSVDNSVYAVDARDGSLVWRFQTEIFHNDNDVGSSPTISPPGENGFADGAAFIASKNGIVYALNLETGAKLWEFRVRDQFFDAGAPRSSAALIDGVLYLGYGSGIYALDAQTGLPVWNSAEVGGPTSEIIASPAITGPPDDRVLFAADLGGSAYAFDLFDGATLWSYTTGGFVFASPAPSASRVFFASDDGFLYAFGFDDGADTRPTSAITAPEAVSASGPTDEIPLDLPGAATFTSICAACHGPAGEGGIAPALQGTELGREELVTVVSKGRDGTAMTAFETSLSDEEIAAVVDFIEALPEPAQDPRVENPDGQLTVAGTAEAESGVGSVLVAVFDENENKWWNATAATWEKVIAFNEAELDNPGGASSTWTFAYPIPFEGSSYYVQAQAVDSSGHREVIAQQLAFTIPSLGDPPETEITSPVFRDVFHFPDGQRQSFSIDIAGTATDSGGANPGISRVNVVIRNIELGSYYCGSPGCGTSGPNSDWVDSFTRLAATLDDPGAISTSWTFSFPTFAEPHKYRIVAWAEDGDGELDSTRFIIMRVCVRDEGDDACV